MCESRKNNLPLAPLPRFGVFKPPIANPQVEAHQRYTLVMDIAFILLHRLLTFPSTTAHGRAAGPARDLVNRPPKRRANGSKLREQKDRHRASTGSPRHTAIRHRIMFGCACPIEK